jgi:hypothetical protein
MPQLANCGIHQRLKFSTNPNQQHTMPPIRLPEIADLQPTSINAPGLRIDALALQGKALGDVARSIAGISDQFHDTAIATQKLENARLVSSNRLRIAEKYATFQQKLNTDPDPGARVSKTRDFLSDMETKLKGEELPPVVRDQILAEFEGFASKAIIDQGATTARLAAKRAALSLENELRAAQDYNNRPAFEAAISTGVDGGLILPEEADRYLTDFDRSYAGSMIQAGIDQDPAGFMLDLEQPDFLDRFPGITPADLPRLKDAARSSAQRMRAEETDLIAAALMENKLQPEDIEAAEYLTATDRAKFKSALDDIQNARPPSAETHGKAWDTLLSLRQAFQDPGTSDSEYAARWNDARAEVLSLVATVPAAYRGDITSELSRRSPAARSGVPDEPPEFSQKAELKTIALDRIARARSAGMFGPIDQDAEPAARERAYRRAEEIRLKVSDFVDRKPAGEIGIEEVTTFTDRLISGDRIKTAVRDFREFIPGSGQRFRMPAQMPALPPLDQAAADPLDIPPGEATASDALLPPRQMLEEFLAD